MLFAVISAIVAPFSFAVLLLSNTIQSIKDPASPSMRFSSEAGITDV
jgi:hypothetical protein